MQKEFSFIKQSKAVAKYKPLKVERVGKKLWFSYVNQVGSIIPAYYDLVSRSFKSVVSGDQYGESKKAVRNLVARPVVESMLQNQGGV